MGKEKTRNCSIRLDINLILLEACSVRCSHITFYQEKIQKKIYWQHLKAKYFWHFKTYMFVNYKSTGFFLDIRIWPETTPLPLVNIILCLSLSINNISHNQEQYNPIRPYIKYEGLPINKNTTTRKNICQLSIPFSYWYLTDWRELLGWFF